MKKITSFLGIFLLAAMPFAALADVFGHDLFMGMLDNPEVRNLQEFLRNRSFYDGPITGNFLSLTQKALIKFQEKENIMPSQGYFGSKTRSRVNALTGAVPSSREEQIAWIRSQLDILQAKLTQMITVQQAASTSTTSIATSPIIASLPSPSPSPSPTPVATTTAPITPPVPAAELRISGTLTSSFPASSGSPVKLGDIVISNTTSHDILFNQFQLDIYDGMNSSLNRGKTVLFKLRNGTTTFDALISETKFDINNDPPPIGGETRRQLNVSFPILVKSGQRYTSSLWLENLDYVINGSLRVQMLTALITDSVIPQGGFTFILTRPQ